MRSHRTVFLKLDSAKNQGFEKGCQAFRETKMHNGGSFIGGPKFVRMSVNERSVLIMVFFKVLFFKKYFSISMVCTILIF